MNKTLLLVDDEENILSALYRLLRQDGYTILRANSGAEGLALLEQHRPGVILSDQRMPNMTGVQFLSEAHKRYPDTVRMVLSGYTDLKSVTDAINEGAIYKFLTKPWDDEFLKATVADAFRLYGILQENAQLQRDLVHANQLLEQHFQDTVTESRHQAAHSMAALRVAQEVMDNLPLAMVGVSDEWRIVLANQALEKLLARNDLYGQLASEVLPAEWCVGLQTTLPAGQATLQLALQQPQALVGTVFEIGQRSGGAGKVLLLQTAGAAS